ncbi:MAG: GNAT family N-acetyltransferase [Anaerolineales bacterium]|nr:GNAT family N-acetyltransferase [Anaerolineales bacterium]
MVSIRQVSLLGTAADIDTIVRFSDTLFREDAGTRDKTVNVGWARENGRSYFSEFVTKNGRCCWLAEVEGQAVGYLAGYISEASDYRLVKTAELESMYVNADYRGQGVGTALATHFIQWTQTQGAKAITVTAYAANQTAINFYQTLGFQPKQLTLVLPS